MYWVVTIKSKQNNIKSSHQLQNILTKLPKDAVHITQSDNPITQLKHARKNLIDHRLRAQELREEFLQEAHEQEIEKGNTKKAVSYLNLRNREATKRTWAMFKRQKNGNKTSGGISHILIPNNTDPTQPPERIQDKEDLDNHLLQRNITHFRQAHSTPFTVSPLLNIIGENGCSQQALDLLEGNMPQEVNTMNNITKLYLSQISRQQQTLPHEITYQQMCSGFHKWREQTTTSPSTKHLGIYKSLVTATKYNIRTTIEQINEYTYTDILHTHSPTAEKCLYLQLILMNLAIRECHTYTRWTIVHNFLLEKIPGQPLINKLRVIHIYEANWSLIQKIFVAHQITKQAAYAKKLIPEQAGGRPGRSAIELGLSRTITYEIIRNQHLTSAILYNDAKACFDRIIENLSNLTLLAQGLPIQVAQLHSQTFQQIQYFIRHKLGIGPTPHSHLNPEPIYGVGQGATDAPGRWGFLSDPLLTAFKSQAHDATIFSPLMEILMNNQIAGFVDDTTSMLIALARLEQYLPILLQRDAQQWEQLLHLTGGKLEISECVFGLFKWIQDREGRFLLDNTTNSSLHIQSSEDNTITLIPQISTTQAYKYVGIQQSLSGIMKAQIQSLKEKCVTFSVLLTLANTNSNETSLGLKTVFGPALNYPLPASSIHKDILRQIQKPLINTSLTKLGFNRHMPRAVVFASIDYGGIGLFDLYTEQCIGQLKMLVSHVRSKSYLYNPILILLHTFQLLAGLEHPPLLDTQHITFVPSPWIQSIRMALRLINAKIHIPNQPHIPRLRNNDKLTLQKEYTLLFTRSEMELINICRIYLQVNTLAEISDNRDEFIIRDAILGTADNNEQPLLWKLSRSKFRWPRQNRPSSKAWRLWKRYITNFTQGTHFKLNQQLGEMNTNTHTQRKWFYVHYNNSIVHTITNRSFILQPSRTQTQKKFRYTQEIIPQIANSSSATPICIQHNEITGYASKFLILHNTPNLTNNPPSISCEHTYWIQQHPSTSNTLVINVYIKTNTQFAVLYQLDKIKGQLSKNHLNNKWSDIKNETISLYCILSLVLSNDTIIPINTDIHCNISSTLQSRINKHLATQLSPSFCITDEWEYLQSIRSAQGKALHNLPRNCKKTTQQFLNEWLPTNASHSLQNTNEARLCPYCMSCDESQHHYLSCPHKESQSNWIKQANQFEIKLVKYNKKIPQILTKLLKTAITDWRTTSNPAHPAFLPPEYQHLCRSQSIVGWNHITQWRFVSEWFKTHPTVTHEWLTYTIRSLLLLQYNCWKERCDRNHGQNATQHRQRSLIRLQPQIEQIYEQSSTMSLTTAPIITITQEELLTRPTYAIQNWIFKAKLCIQTNLKARKQKIKNAQKTIHPFFNNVPDRAHRIIRRPDRVTLRDYIPTTLTTFFPLTNENSKARSKNDLRPP